LGIGIRAVIGGYVLVAVLQGFISWIGFWIFGAASPAIWAMLTLVAALIPSFGASVMYALVILSLLLQHHIGGAIGLFFWWIVAVSIIDNFVGPKFISGRSKINIILLLFSILGGIKLFGPAGFVIGPTIIIFFWSVLEMFQESGILPGTAPSIITEAAAEENKDEEDSEDIS
jgi:predicted PurR-regulated permease PerM